MKPRGLLAGCLLLLAGGCGSTDFGDPPGAVDPPPSGGVAGAPNAAGAGQGGGGAAGPAGSAGAGGGGEAGAGGGGGAAETWPAPTPLVWVNPSRCYPECAFRAPDLVWLDDVGELLAGECTCEQGEPAPGSCSPDCCPRIERAAQPAFTALMRALRAEGLPAGIMSSYRDYATQKCIFAEFESEPGRAARPGHSEHELGLAVDVGTNEAGYGWLAARVHEFGFALSFPAGKQKVTGFRPEPWHVRYVGSRVALAIRDGGLTPEEYFRAHPAEATSASCDECPDPVSRPPCGALTTAGECLAGTSVLAFCYEDGVALSPAADPQYLAEVDCAVVGDRCVVDGAGDATCAPP